MLNWVNGLESGGDDTEVPGIEISIGGAMVVVTSNRKGSEG